ncbi:MAG: hypothetical protein KKF46_04110 [Nanoarchaeota archaeon]|nr:hypothetical protein [Nanoarchaeota archaeon]MBU1321519.1 hypothetical protein [Nanoarchaeota archaeon]MBU1597136.1 hypothetical protein [Nanoarchaeota archaeon]MBU2441067.1 hypothetical protein [Nanoarchaeota archaeon]
MDWYDVTWANLTNATAYIEHRDIKIDVWLEYFDGTSWVEVCDLPEDNATDRLDSCLLDLNTNLSDIKLRLAFVRTTICHEELDHAYILATYCYYPEEKKEGTITPLSLPPKSSRGGGGGGGGALGFTEWDCGEWSECIDGTQTRNCTLNSAMKTETQNCTVNKTIEGLGLGVTGGTGGTGRTGSTGGTQTFTFGMPKVPTIDNVPLLKEKNDITGMIAGFSTGFTSAVTTAVAINWYAIAIILMIVFCLPLFFYFISKK